MGWGSTIGSILGGAVGSLGGPLGIGIGSSLGGSLGGSLDGSNKPKTGLYGDLNPAYLAATRQTNVIPGLMQQTGGQSGGGPFAGINQSMDWMSMFGGDSASGSLFGGSDSGTGGATNPFISRALAPAMGGGSAGLMYDPASMDVQGFLGSSLFSSGGGGGGLF